MKFLNLIMSIFLISPWVSSQAGLSQIINYPNSSKGLNELFVTKTTDTNDGVCDSDCSLREAVILANSLSETITIHIPSGTYLLNLTGANEDSSLTGDLDINSNQILIGAGQSETIIDGNVTDRVFHILSNNSVELHDLTIQNGSSDKGGGIYAYQVTLLKLSRTTIKNNSSTNTGGGLHCSGTSEIFQSIFHNNSSTFGGGIQNYSHMTIQESEIYENYAAWGGGIYSQMLSNLEVEKTNIYNNHGSVQGGGIYSAANSNQITMDAIFNNRSLNGGGLYLTSGISYIENTTISSNLASNCNEPDCGDEGNGGGIWSWTTVNILNSTITNNHAGGTGGGIYNNYESSTFSFHNSIISDNNSDSLIGLNCAGNSITSLGNNLENINSCNLNHPDDINNIETLLGTLQLFQNSSPFGTYAHSINILSPAVDSGNDTVCPEFDQRGESRPIDGNDDSIAACDIGALEKTEFLAFTVTTGLDVVDNNLGDKICNSNIGECTLRAAIQEANVSGGAIIYLDVVEANSIKLTIQGIDEDNALTGDLDIKSDIVFADSGRKIIFGNYVDRIFDIIDGRVVFENLILVNGLTSGDGGAIRNQGHLSLINVEIRDNEAPRASGIYNTGDLTILGSLINNSIFNNYGGINVTYTRFNETDGNGIYNYNGDVTVGYSSFLNNAKGIYNLDNLVLSNSSISNGDIGILNNSGNMQISGLTVNSNQVGIINGLDSTMDIVNSTIANNTEIGISNDGIMNISSSTIHNQTILVYNYRQNRGMTTIQNSIISSGDMFINCDVHGGEIRSVGYNLSSDDSCNFIKPTDLINTDPLLGELSDNGGTTLTMPLLSGSSAIDSGLLVDFPRTDQRGYTRPEGLRCDIGAFEYTWKNLFLPILLK